MRKLKKLKPIRKIAKVKNPKESEFPGDLILSNITKVDSFGELKQVYNEISGNTEAQLVVATTKVAELFNVSYQTIWRWTSETHQLPSPVFILSENGQGKGVYHVEELKIMIRIIGEHLRTSKYFRKDHSDVTNKLSKELNDFRLSIASSNKGVRRNGSKKRKARKSFRRKIR